jgi:hypothetical protein
MFDDLWPKLKNRTMGSLLFAGRSPQHEYHETGP